MVKQSVAMVINYQDHVLLGLKDPQLSDSLAGKWHIPAGTKKLGESDLETGIREGYEETTLIIHPTNNYLGRIITPKQTILRFHEFTTRNGNPQAGSDLIDLKWVMRTDIYKHLQEQLYESWPQQLHEYFR